MERRFRHDFSTVRIHSDAAAVRSADDLGAHAYTLGRHIVFGAGRLQPDTSRGRHLLAHELTHTIQQNGSPPAHVAAGHHAPAPPAAVQRQSTSAAPGQATAEDRWAGTTVRQITVSLARGRVGFQTAVGMILGNVKTDLKAGSYRLKPDVPGKRWVITAPPVSAGWHFTVSLEGADPWALAYPDEIPLLVTPGSSVEPKTFGEMLGPEDQLIDPLWLHEDLPPELAPGPVTGIDDFFSVHYDLSYRWEKGDLSKWLVVHYRDGTSKDIHIDTINESYPRLMAAKKDVLKIMDDYNALFILQTVPTVFFVLTIAPTVSTAGLKGPFSVRRTQVPKNRFRGGGKTPESGTRTEPGGGKTDEEVSTFATQQRRAQELASEIARRDEKVVVNMGGAGAPHEPEGAINVNNQSVPRKNIPNLVEADASRVGELFEPGSVDRFEGHNMAPEVIDWDQAAPGVHRALRPGGTLDYYYRSANADAKTAEAALRKVQPPFQKVENIRDVHIKAVK